MPHTPHCSRKLRGNFRANAPSGTPQDGVFVYCPLSGSAGPLAAPAPRQRLTQAGCRVSRVAASVVSIPHGINLLLHMLPAAFFLPPKRTPPASSIRASLTRRSAAKPVGPAQDRVAFSTRRLVTPSIARSATAEASRRRSATSTPGNHAPVFALRASPRQAALVLGLLLLSRALLSSSSQRQSYSTTIL